MTPSLALWPGVMVLHGTLNSEQPICLETNTQGHFSATTAPLFIVLRHHHHEFNSESVFRLMQVISNFL